MVSRKDIMELFPYDTPRKEQAELLTTIQKHWKTTEVFVIVAPTACHGKNEQVLMYSGEIKMVQDIKVGDVLVGPDSKPRTVLSCTTGVGELHEITTKRNNPTKFVVTGNHVLPLKQYTNTGRHDRVGGKKYEIRDTQITVDEWYGLSKTAKHCRKLWKPDNIQLGYQGNQTRLLTPYELGLWLGDGHSASASITTMDSEISEAWQDLGTRLGISNVRVETQPNNKASTFSLTNERGIGNPIISWLRSRNLHNNKHIPKDYLALSYELRLELLAGLMDTDGNFNQASCNAEITQKRKALADDVLLLVRSLGFNANMGVRYIKQKPYYRVCFSGTNLDKIPLRIERKKLAVNSKRDMRHTGFSIKPIGVGEYFGFTVDGDNLYLMWDGTVTHNCGKTALGYTIGRYAGNTSVITPTNMLVRQFADEFEPAIGKLMKRNQYTCPAGSELVNRDVTCEEGYTKLGGRKVLGCSMQCEYIKDLRRARSRGVGIYNYYLYMAHKLFRPTLIVDEAHGLIPTIQDLEAKKLWQHDWRFPNSLRNYADLAWWLESLEDYQKTDLLAELEEELHSTRPKYIVERTKDLWRRTTPPELRSLLKLLPIDIRDAMPHFWPAKTKKIVLMSATISRKDIEALGLDRRRVLYLEATSPIPISNRPIIPMNVVGVNAGNLKPATKKIADYIKQELLPKHEHEKGVIHATYQQARLLREYLGDLNGRIIYHDKTNTQTQFDKFTEAPPESGAVFVASGLYEGIDLAYDLGRWQCIAKIPWLSLVDPAVKYKSQQDEEWYIWETAKKTIQACGRISRTPTDYGVTYVLDSTFERMRSKLVDYGLAPQWWLEAIARPASLDKPK